MPYQVDLNPDLAPVAVRPTLKNPEIKVVIGKNDNGYGPRAVIYPDSMPVEEGISKAKAFQAAAKDCPVCKKYAAEQKVNIAFIIALAVLIGGAFVAYRMIKKEKAD